MKKSEMAVVGHLTQRVGNRLEGSEPVMRSCVWCGCSARKKGRGNKGRVAVMLTQT